VHLNPRVADVQKIAILEVYHSRIFMAILELAGVYGVVSLNNEYLSDQVNQESLAIVIVELHDLKVVDIDFIYI
jgi:hypothetical protein